MKSTISVTDVLRNFADYINRVAYRGERFILMRGGKPVAELSPVPSGTRLGELPGLLGSLPRLSDGDADELGREISEARGQLEAGPVQDPWVS